MNLSYKWLRELVACDESPEALAAMLTGAGCAVEELNPVGDDTQLVAEVTSNRPDWLCHLGVAHEIAALTGAALSAPAWELQETAPPVVEQFSVTVEAPDLCPRYTARLIKGVTIKESPAWLKQKLEAIGLRPINNVVDITNFVLFEMNQPLHAFDADLLRGNQIIVRRGRKGETITAIDESECKLTEEMLVIADAERPVAIAGVMGGAETEVSSSTVNVLLEAASFESTQVRRTSRALRLQSDSSYRFERALDLAAVDRASARATALILELAGGELCSGIIDSAPQQESLREVSMRYARCTKILGTELPKEDIHRAFVGLGLETVSDTEDAITVRVPSFRNDITREIDLIEEAVRVVGYERVPPAITMRLERSHEPATVSAGRIAREVLVGLGYHECVTDSFVPLKWDETFSLDDTVARHQILNPINTERPHLRSTLCPSLLDVRRVNRNEDTVCLFELNRVYGIDGPSSEPKRLALLDDRGTEWLRGAVEAVCAALRLDAKLSVELATESFAGLEDGSVAHLLANGERIGVMGIADKGQMKLHDLNSAPAVLELDFETLAHLARKRRVFTPLARFPGVRRDIALVVPETVKWLTIETEARSAYAKMEELALESVYRGKGIDAGEKSVAFSFVVRADDRSLTDEEANAVRDDVVRHLTAQIPGSRLR